MAKRKSAKRKSKKGSRRVSKKRPAMRRAASKRKSAKKRSAKRGATKRSSAKRPSAKAAPAPKIRQGVITHTELASADPTATKQWCQQVLGWKFGESMPTPAGPYHMWRFDSMQTGGGIRANNPPEVPGSIPYVEVTSIRDTYAKALDAGAREMLWPQELPGGMGWIAIVAAPGGVPIGFWAMK